MGTRDSHEGSSAAVRIRLEIGEHAIPLAETGTVSKRRDMGYGVPYQPQDLPPGTEGTLVICIDDTELRWSVVLEGGAVPFDTRLDYRIKEYPSQACLFRTHNAADEICTRTGRL